MESRKIIQIEDKVPFRLLVPLSIQHMFAMFGASVLVPFLFGISPAIVLFMNGVGTLLFILREGRRLIWVPVLPFLRRRESLSARWGIRMRWEDSSLWDSAAAFLR